MEIEFNLYLNWKESSVSSHSAIFYDLQAWKESVTHPGKKQTNKKTSFSPNGKEKDWHTSSQDEMREEILRHVTENCREKFMK